jgi:hypothetical protein
MVTAADDPRYEIGMGMADAVFKTRRIVAVDALSGLSAQLRRYGETVAHIARSNTALAERIAAVARR